MIDRAPDDDRLTLCGGHRQASAPPVRSSPPPPAPAAPPAPAVKLPQIVKGPTKAEQIVVLQAKVSMLEAERTELKITVGASPRQLKIWHLVKQLQSLEDERKALLGGRVPGRCDAPAVARVAAVYHERLSETLAKREAAL